MTIYVPQLKRILIYPQGIDTQEGKPVFLKFMASGTGPIPNEYDKYAPIRKYEKRLHLSGC